MKKSNKNNTEDSRIKRYMDVVYPDDEVEEQTYTKADRRRIMRLGKRAIRRSKIICGETDWITRR